MLYIFGTMTIIQIKSNVTLKDKIKELNYILVSSSKRIKLEQLKLMLRILVMISGFLRKILN